MVSVRLGPAPATSLVDSDGSGRPNRRAIKLIRYPQDMAVPAVLRPILRPKHPLIAWLRVAVLIALAAITFAAEMYLLTPIFILVGIWASVEAFLTTQGHRVARRR